MTRFHYANTKDSDLLYLTGSPIHDPFFFLETEGSKYVFLGSTDIDAFTTSGREDVVAVDVTPLRAKAAAKDGDVLGNLALSILRKYKVTGEIVVSARFPVRLADVLRGADIPLCVQNTWCPERARKSPEEVKAIRENFAHTKKAFVLVEELLAEARVTDDRLMLGEVELTSEILKREVGKFLLDLDLENSDGAIISSGPHTAMPHHAGSGPIRPNQPIIVDLFPQSSVNHYFADMTRTYVKGEPSDEVHKMYAAVRHAQLEALTALRPGLSCKAAYELSAAAIESAGFDVGKRGYTHGLGHGLGVAVHEEPDLGPNAEGVLEPGNVITVEPGLYYKNTGGVRLEDTVLITKDGYEDLTSYAGSWVIP